MWKKNMRIPTSGSLKENLAGNPDQYRTNLKKWQNKLLKAN